MTDHYFIEHELFEEARAWCSAHGFQCSSTRLYHLANWMRGMLSAPIRQAALAELQTERGAPAPRHVVEAQVGEALEALVRLGGLPAAFDAHARDYFALLGYDKKTIIRSPFATRPVRDPDERSGSGTWGDT